MDRPMNLSDLAAQRLGELARLLAGAALIDPLAALDAFETIEPEDITDDRARGFMLALARHRDRVQNGKPKNQPEAAQRICLETGYQANYPGWLGLTAGEPGSAAELAERCADEIQRTVIALDAFHSLARYGRENQLKHGWGNRATRQSNDNRR